MTPADFATLRKQVQTDEGMRLKPYTDTGGRVSIGYGRNLTDVGISQVEAGMLLQNDLERAVSDVQRGFPFVLELDSVRQIVLADMCFNLGLDRLSKFTKMWAAIRGSAWETAATEMLTSQWAEQVGARATRLAEAMRSGEFP